MHKSTSPRRKSFKPYAVASAALGISGVVGALVAGVTPAAAANLANQPDTQIAVFMVPLTLLLLVMLFEVARFAMRGPLPSEAPARRRQSPEHWSPAQREG